MQTLRLQKVVAPGYDDANTLFGHKSHAQGGDICVCVCVCGGAWVGIEGARKGGASSQ